MLAIIQRKTKNELQKELEEIDQVCEMTKVHYCGTTKTKEKNHHFAVIEVVGLKIKKR